MQSSDMGWIRTNLDFPILWAFPESLFRAGGVLASFQVFINVYKHYGSTEKTYWIQGLDPRSKIQDPGKNFLDPRSVPRSKIQDSRKNFLDPRSGSKIQDPRFQEKLLGSKVWIQDPRSKIPGKTSWIRRQSFPRSEARFRCGSKKFFLESWILDPDLGSKKFFLESWILDLGSRPWIQEVFPRILDLGSWIQTLDPRSFSQNLGSWILDPDLGSKKFFPESWILDPTSTVFINVYKHHLQNQQKNA